MSITAEQARENSKSSNHGTEEVLRDIYRSIEVTSKTGSRTVAKIFSKDAVSDAEMKAAISDIESKGYEVILRNDSSSHHTLSVKW